MDADSIGYEVPTSTSISMSTQQFKCEKSLGVYRFWFLIRVSLARERGKRKEQGKRQGRPKFRIDKIGMSEISGRRTGNDTCPSTWWMFRSSWFTIDPGPSFSSCVEDFLSRKTVCLLISRTLCWTTEDATALPLIQHSKRTFCRPDLQHSRRTHISRQNGIRLRSSQAQALFAANWASQTSFLPHVARFWRKLQRRIQVSIENHDSKCWFWVSIGWLNIYSPRIWERN